jgi:DNA-binding beta-propeller fold protein YncE
LLLILVLSLCLLLPRFSLGQEIEVSFEEITPSDGGGAAKTEFLPGEEIQVRVRLRVLQATGNPFAVRLRISGDGWHEMLRSESVLGPGLHWITFSETEQEDDLRVPTTAGEGKVSLLMDAFSTQDTVGLQGRRHQYLEIRCPEGLPAGVLHRLSVGANPSDMALTANGRYLYVTSGAGPKVTVIDVETKEVVPTELENSGAIVVPTGVAAHPLEPVMYIADSAVALQVLHVVNAETHVLQQSIGLNPTGEFDVRAPGDVAVNLAGTEVYVADTGFPTVLVVQLNPPAVRALSLSAFPAPPAAGLLPLQVMLDPANPRAVNVLCAGLNEVIKLDVVSGAILAFVRLRDLLDPSSLWPAWSMALNRERDEIYVVVNPNDLDLNPLTFKSKIFTLDRRTLAKKKELLLEGASIWELVVREDGRFVYAIDSSRGEVLVIDMDTGTEMSRCAIPVERGARMLRADPAQNRLFVGGGLAGFVNIVE